MSIETATATPEDLTLDIEGVDLGAVNTTEAAEDTDFPTLPASTFHYEKDTDGKSKKVYDVIYGFEFARHAEVRQGRGFRKNEKVYALRAKALDTAPDTDFRPTIFDEFGRFPTPEEVRAQVLADGEIPTDEKETRTGKRLRGLQFEKARMVSLARAIAPLTLNDLRTAGQGVLIGVALSQDVQKNGSMKNAPLRYFAASAITVAVGEEGVPEEVPEEDIPF
jgi:hypothetical protein